MEWKSEEVGVMGLRNGEMAGRGVEDGGGAVERRSEKKGERRWKRKKGRCCGGFEWKVERKKWVRRKRRTVVWR